MWFLAHVSRNVPSKCTNIIRSIVARVTHIFESVRIGTVHIFAGSAMVDHCFQVECFKKFTMNTFIDIIIVVISIWKHKNVANTYIHQGSVKPDKSYFSFLLIHYGIWTFTKSTIDILRSVKLFKYWKIKVENNNHWLRCFYSTQFSSPCLLRICEVRWHLYVVAYEQSGHFNGFCPRCLQMCARITRESYALNVQR